jgi:hypothetical protein
MWSRSRNNRNAVRFWREDMILNHSHVSRSCAKIRSDILVKIKLSLCLITPMLWRRNQRYRSVRTSPWRFMVSFTSRPLYHKQKVGAAYWNVKEKRFGGTRFGTKKEANNNNNNNNLSLQVSATDGHNQEANRHNKGNNLRTLFFFLFGL